MAKEEALPYYKWLVRDYRANRKVTRMSWQAKGLYRELLDEFWIDGPLPNDMHALADICGCTVKDFTKFWPEIEPHFYQDEQGRWVNSKMDSLRTEKDLQRVSRQVAGRLGGLAKLRNASTDVADASEPEASAKQVLASAKQVPYSRAEHKQSREEQKQIAPSPAGVVAVASPMFLAVPLNDKSQHPVTEADVIEWQALFPAIDVRQEIREVKAWSDANPQRRKTKAGVRRFIVAWLGRAQDKGGSGMAYGANRGSPAAARVESGANAFRQAGVALGFTGTGRTDGANGSALSPSGHGASGHELPIRHASADGKARAAEGQNGVAHTAYPPRTEVLSPPYGSC